MIKCDKGTVIIQGNSNAVMAEFAVIISKIRECLVESVGVEEANKEIAKCGRLALLDKEELSEVAARHIIAGESVDDILDEKIKGGMGE